MRNPTIGYLSMKNQLINFFFLQLIFRVLYPSFVWGQGHTVLHLDRPYYLPGQVMHYVISINPPIQDTAILNVQLVSDQQSVMQHYHQLVNSAGSGYFPLPFDIHDGIYLLQVDLLSKSSGYPYNLVNTPVSILPEIVPLGFSAEVAAFDAPAPKDHISISVSEQARPRQIVQCTVEVNGGLPNDLVSIAIKDKSFFKQIAMDVRSFRIPDDPLLEMIPIKGVRTLLNEDPKEDAFLFAAKYNDLTFSFNWVDASGDFFIRFPIFYGKETLFFIDNGRNQMEVELAGQLVSPPKSVPIIASPGTKLGIETYADRKKIYQVYSSLEELTLQRDPKLSTNTVSPNYDVDVQDYSVRGKLIDLVKEITTPLKFRKGKGNQYTAKILYEVLGLKYFYSDDPLVFINGVASRDFDFVANLPLQDIKSLRIYSALNTIRALKLVDIGGVVIIEMVDPLFSIPPEIRLPGIEIQGLQLPAEYPITSNTESNIPQLRSLLFWQPNGRLGSDGSYIFDLPCSDDIFRL